MMANVSTNTSGDSLDELATGLQKWMVEEMHFEMRGRHAISAVPVVDDFKWLCRGRMFNVWKHLMTHVRSAETVKKIKGNLALKSHQQAPQYQVNHKVGSHYSEEDQELKKRHALLTADLTKTLSNIGHLHNDIKRLQKDITSTEREYREACADISDVRRSAALLSIYSDTTQEQVHQYEEYKKQMRLKSDSMKQLSMESDENNHMYSRSTDGNSKKDILETACSKQIRETSGKIGDFLQHLLQGSFGSDKNAMGKKKEQLWQHVEHLMSQHSPQKVVQALTLLTEDTALVLRNKTATIDIRKDAEELRFKYEKGGQLSDLENPPSVLQSVHQLLQDSQAKHVERAIDVVRMDNSSWRLQQRLNHSQEIAHAILREQYGADPGAHHMAKTLLQVETTLAGDQACLYTLNNLCEDLKEGINTAMHEKEILYGKYRSIQDFKKLADGKQSLIRVLVKQNVQAPEQLAEQQKEIVHYIRENLDNHEIEAADPGQQLQEAATEEVDIFTSLSLPHLMFALLDSAYKVAVIDLSIHRLHGRKQTSSGQMISKILQELEFPNFQGSECLLPHVMKLQQQISEIETTLQAHNTMSCRVMECKAGNPYSAKHIADLCESVATHDREQLDRVLPMLQQRLSQAIKALTDCLAVKDVMQNWWEQPARLTVPWVMIDEANLQQWHDKWTVAITRLRQLQVQVK